jgi:chromosome segregation ATPase
MDTYVHSIPMVQENMKQLGLEQTGMAREKDEINNELNALDFSARTPHDSIRQAQHELDNLKDSKQIFLNRLNQQPQYRDVIKAKKWLDQHRNQLTGECYGPLGMYIEVRKQAAETSVDSSRQPVINVRPFSAYGKYSTYVNFLTTTHIS